MARFWLGCAVASAVVCLVWAEQEDDSDLLRQKRLIGNIITSTTTVLTITTVSTELPVSCLVNTLPTVACTGRRRRRHTAAPPPAHLESPSHTGGAPSRLYGSLAEETGAALTSGDPAALTRQAEESEQKARIFLFATRFVTSLSVVTWYTTSINESTTVSFSIACTAAGQNLLTRRCVSP